MSELETFSDRLDYVLGGRVRNVWGKRLGFNSANVTRMFRNDIPGHELLSAIARSENLNLSWLMTGRGLPFQIYKQDTPEGVIEQFKALLDEDWKDIYVANTPLGVLIALRNPGQYDYKGKVVDYTIVELLAGPLSEGLVLLLNDAREKSQIHLCRIPSSKAHDAINGNAGTFILFGDEDHEGILSHPEGLLGECDLDIWDLQPEKPKPASGPADTQLMRAVIEHIDNMLIEEGIELDIPTRARLITAGYRSAEAKGGVDPVVIQAIIEAAS